MATEAKTLSDLGAIKTAAPAEAPVHVQKLDKLGRAYATGKRKDAVARVWIKPARRHHGEREGLHQVLRAPPCCSAAEAAAQCRQPAYAV